MDQENSSKEEDQQTKQYFKIHTDIKDSNNQSKKRLIINKIAMENFKSYFGRLEIGCFHRRFTAIVGPNGSGKSNLIESLLFVFGKRANWMRLKSLHQLIHNSSQHNDIKKASVEVEFMEVDDQGNEIFDLPNTKFTVKRTVHHTGATNYHINEQHASMEQVVTLLQGKGIDLANNRFLILQGEVEQISMMRPKSGDHEKPGILEYLEDIIGSVEFQKNIDELGVEYEKLDSVRRERGEVMKIVENEMVKLEPAKNKAIQFVRYEKQAWQLQNVQLQVQQYKYIQQSNKLNGKNEELKQEEWQVQKENKESVQKNVEVMKRFKEFKEGISQLKEQIESYENSMKSFSESDEKCRDQIKNLSENQVRINKKLSDITKERNDISEEMIEIQTNLPQLEQKLIQMQQQRELDEKRVQQLDSEHKQATQSQLNDKKKLQQKIQPQILEREQLMRDLELLKSRAEGVSKVQAIKDGDIKKMLAEIEKYNHSNSELNVIIEKMNEVLKKIRELQTHENVNLQNNSQSISNINYEIEQLRSLISGIQQNLNSQNQQNLTVKSIMEASAKGQIQGVIGRMGDLGTIPKEYDAAITTSSYGGLNSILVENDEVAQKCINFLKLNKIGRQAFISLKRVNEMYHHEMSQNFITPNLTHRLFDLIKPRKEEYRTAFYKIVQNTLVCDNLEIAKQVKFQQKRNLKIVTKDGKIIDNANVMSGGGQVRYGGMISSSKFNNINNNDGLNEYKSKQDELQNRKIKFEHDGEEIRRKLLNLEREEQQIMKALNERTQEFKSNEDKLDENNIQIQFMKAQKDKKEQSDQQRQLLEKDIDEIQSRITKIEDSYKNEKQQINEILLRVEKQESSELKELKANMNKLIHGIDTHEQQYNKQKAQMIINNNRLKKLQQEETEYLNKLQITANEISNILVKQKEFEDQTLCLIGRLKAAKDEHENKQNQFNSSKSESTAFQEQLIQIKKKIQDIKEKRDANTNLINKANDEVKEITKRLDYVRRNYKETLREYDFLGEIDQIANISFSKQQIQDISLLDDQTLLNISIVDDLNITNIDGDDQDEFRGNIGIKRRSNIIADLQTILEYDVTQNLESDKLQQFIPIEKEIARALAHIQAKNNEISKETNVLDITTYKGKFQDYKEKRTHLDNVKDEQAQNKKKSDQLKKDRYNMFMNGFNIISTKLRQTYQSLTNGGDAELELVDTMDPFSEGVSFSVRPKNKSWKQMSKLSGGEKTLASLSLIFALHYFRPTPLYFFDEVDAALDYKNVSIVANFVKERAHDAQFIVISLRNNMFELASKLVGIYKTFDMTKTISIQPQKVQSRMDTKSEEQENQRYKANQAINM